MAPRWGGTPVPTRSPSGNVAASIWVSLQPAASPAMSSRCSEAPTPSWSEPLSSSVSMCSPGTMPGEHIDTEELSGSDHDGVGASLHLDDIAGLAAGCRLTQMEAATLPDGERVGTGVPPHRGAIRVDDPAGLLAEAGRQPRAGVAVRDE